MPGKSPRGGTGKLNPHLQKKVEAQEKHQAEEFVKQRSTELDEEIKAMESKLASGNAASAAELRESGQVSSTRILDSRSFFSKLKAKMMDSNINTKGKRPPHHVFASFTYLLVEQHHSNFSLSSSSEFNQTAQIRTVKHVYRRPT